MGVHPQAFLIDEANGLYPRIETLFKSQDGNKVNIFFKQCCQNVRKNCAEPELHQKAGRHLAYATVG